MTQLVSRLSAAMHYASTQADVSTPGPPDILRHIVPWLHTTVSQASLLKAGCPLRI